MHDAFGRAADEDVLEARAAVRGQDDQLDFVLGGVVADARPGDADGGVLTHVWQFGELFLYQPCQALARAIQQFLLGAGRGDRRGEHDRVVGHDDRACDVDDMQLGAEGFGQCAGVASAVERQLGEVGWPEDAAELQWHRAPLWLCSSARRAIWLFPAGTK